MTAKKQSLFPLMYDEISLVDSGAAGDADVLIMKRDSFSEVLDLDGEDIEKWGAPTGNKPKSTPCNPKSSTGAKTGKSSKRAKTWAGGKHPRQKGGKFGQTSSASKKKYGKGGTTKAKQQAACRRRKPGGVSTPPTKPTATKKKPKYTLQSTNSAVTPVTTKRKRKKIAGVKTPGTKPSSTVRSGGSQLGAGETRKNIMKSWKTDAQLRALMERKPR